MVDAIESFGKIDHAGSYGVSGVASPTIWSCYANFKSLSLFISLEIDCFHGL